jgi:hypothetical protein
MAPCGGIDQGLYRAPAQGVDEILTILAIPDAAIRPHIISCP